MGEQGKVQRFFAAIVCVCLLAMICFVKTSAGSVPEPEIGTRLIPVGKAVGIKLFSDGVLVVGLSEVETDAGELSPGKACGLKAGDVITHINGNEVDTIEQVQEVLREQGENQLTIQAIRSDKALQLTVHAAENKDGVKQLGVWLRDSMAGIGTVTFYDPASGVFAALGHGINDTDTSALMRLESGSIMPASVAEVKKGLPGQPGELRGQFELTKDLGSLYANTERGVFGTTDQLGISLNVQPMETAKRDEVKTGKATILSNVRGNEVEEFEVELVCVDRASGGARNMLLKVTDPELLSLTGGIVQGMSGSPVIQNGRIVGAVTHVLVNDPTRGYGIFIENMLEAAK